ncbi:MAG: hypothetical protein ACRDZQ_04440 [Acidimicrobiales bacterium]
MKIGGMSCSFCVSTIEKAARRLDRLRLSGLVTSIGFGLMVAMWAGVREPIFPWMVLTLALIQVFVVGRNILAMAWPSVRQGILNQHVLLEFGALGGLLGGSLGFAVPAFSVPDFLGASLFITTYHLLSGCTSGYLRTRTSKAVARLMALQPWLLGSSGTEWSSSCRSPRWPLTIWCESARARPYRSTAAWWRAPRR